ncbi:patatin-like phospholipase family protein [Ilumatobacter nonamiensis]|uniref:patatin-like phospholipase family protein n=1 Tax=Ilumatobacter nonamiensis TaxID=467093 RepID=UPI00034A4AD4|nr:patatin-like phospholipase family protein [Ilumatobacter nonamiensis]
MSSVAVVLGAGGIVGAAYHAGVLTALAEAGFDARDADLIVGTSAGSGVAATLRAGFPPLDLAPRSRGRSISAEAAAVVGDATGPPTFDFTPTPWSRPPLPSSPGLLFHGLRHPTKALAGLMPTGTIPSDVIGERIDAMYRGRAWPDRPTWICVVDLGSGDRVVFGRNDVDPAIGIAVQASSSIPGFFRPVVHEGRRYIDGGAHSPTNADLVADGGYDLVVVVSPMSATTDANRNVRPTTRRMHARQLAGEIKTVRKTGADVLTFQPTAADLAAMGPNAMDSSTRAATTVAALASTRERLSDPNVAERLDILRRVSRRR